MSDLIKKRPALKDKDNFPFIVFAVLLLVFHIPLSTDFGDELWAREIWNEGRLFPFLAEFWHTWSSRLIINFTGMLFSGLPQIFWKIANISVMVSAAVCVSKLFVYDNRGHNAGGYGNGGGVGCSRSGVGAGNAVIVSLFLMYNLYEMSSTGWISASVGYMWPAASCLYVLLSIKRALRSEKFKMYEYPLIIAALVFTANQELLCAVLLAVYLYYVCRAAYDNLILRQKRRVSRFVILQSLVCLASLAYILLCPGNPRRYEAEAARFFPGHAALTFLEKASIGFSSTLNYFVMTPNVLFIALSLLLAAGIFAKYKNPWARAAAVTPLLVNAAAFAYVFFDYFMADGALTLKNPRDIFQLYGILGAGDAARFYIPHLLYAAMICSFTLCIYLFFRGTDKFFFLFGVLFLGIASHSMMGLSPTVFASSYRTYLFLNFSFIIAALIIYQNIIDYVKPKTLRCINALIILIAAANYLAIPVGYQIVKPFFGRP